MDEVRIGCLGAARIAPAALVRPAGVTPGVAVTAIAARDRAKAVQFAGKHHIPVVHDSYDALIADPNIDAIYNPLPNGLHGKWTIRALEAGKHVLCEKPFTANAEEARSVAAAAEGTGLVLMEAFHWRYHPLAARVLEILGEGAIGEMTHITSALCFPLPSRSDIRWQLDLAGGALMDAGCYPVHIVRSLTGAEPRVVSASARLRSPGVDRRMEAALEWPDGRTGRVLCSMWSSTILRLGIKITGTEGTISVFNPQGPHLFNRVTVKGRRRWHERVRGGPTYEYQMAAFRSAVVDGTPTLTPPSDSIANMSVIDAIYGAAGLEPRQPTA